MTNQYIPNTDSDRKAMLKAIGVDTVEDLLETIPRALRVEGGLNLPRPMPEQELARHMKEMARKNGDVERFTNFLGAGVYHHYIPSVVNHLAAQQGFTTSYTPYQPEVSQGTLQAIYEFQTYVAILTGLDIANASMYDGASAAAEAVLMAKRVTKRNEVILPKTLHPEYRRVIATYIQRLDINIREVPYKEDGRTDLQAVQDALTDRTAALVIQSPNFFGCVEEPGAIAETLNNNSTLLIQCATEALSLAALRPPGECGADIFAGEGQSFGNPLSFGGPHVGLFAARKDFVRNMPGRLVGETKDKNGERGYVLTLATREQHIRRGRATSNICSNHSLCALRAAIYLSTLGREGIRGLALMNMKKAAYAKGLICSVDGFEPLFSSPCFNEFAVKTPKAPAEINKALEREGIVGGLDLAGHYPELGHAMLLCVTETMPKEEIDRLATIVSSI